MTTRLTKVSAGHYQAGSFEIKRIRCGGGWGLPTMVAWVITESLPNGKTRSVTSFDTLAEARVYLEV